MSVIRKDIEEIYLHELRNFLDGERKLKQLPKKHTLRKIIFEYFASFFEEDRIYSETEVNEIINGLHTFRDAAFFRRELYNSRYLGRKKDCSEYWLEKQEEKL